MTNPTQNTKVPEGRWGGAHVHLHVTATGGTLQFDCARGELNEPLQTDADGRFDVAGTFTLQFGPIRLKVPRPARPARYSGRVKGETMTLIVKLADAEDPEEFSLKRGRSGRLTKCR